MRPSRKFSLRASPCLLGLFTTPICSLLLPTLYSRTMASSSSSNPPPPEQRAAEIVDKLPSHPSLVTKTGAAILGSGLLATAISQELYVFNEETVIAFGYIILFAYIAKVRQFVFLPRHLTLPITFMQLSPGSEWQFYSSTPFFLLFALFCDLRGRRTGC